MAPVAGDGVSDDALQRVLGRYAGMVARVLADPQRWLPHPESAGAPRGRLVRAVSARTVGAVHPATPGWSLLPRDERVDWWVDRISTVAGLAAGAPRFGGLLADRLLVPDALGAAASGLGVCAVAREHGVEDPEEWVPLLARVLLDRDLARPLPGLVPDAVASDEALTTGAREEGHRRGVGAAAHAAGRTVWRLARVFLAVDDLLDRRPRGPRLARLVGKAPVVGLLGGWVAERGAIRRAAAETDLLLRGRPAAG